LLLAADDTLEAMLPRRSMVMLSRVGGDLLRLCSTERRPDTVLQVLARSRPCT
jgi:hypothetical protein